MYHRRLLRANTRGSRNHADVLDVAGYDAVCAGNGAEALERLEDGPAPFLIVVDPEEAARGTDSFWRDGRLSGVPMVVVTSLDEIERHAAFPGAGSAFSKPVNIEALLGAIAANLQSMPGRVPCPSPDTMYG